MTESFIVLTSPRSGSTWLVDTINRHEHLEAFGEQFNSDLPESAREGIPAFINAEEFDRHSRPMATFRYLRRYYPLDRPRGFKLLYGQSRHFPEIVAAMTFRRDRIIHLVRKNQLNVLISLQIVYTHLKRWRLLNTEEPPDRNMQIELNPSSIYEDIKRKYDIINMARRYLKWVRMPHMEIFYEDLAGSEAGFYPVWDFLEVNPPEEVGKTRYKKVQTRKHHEVISNYNEICEALKGTEYFNLLDH
jgi:LPS sulfotransferase NodH